MPGIEIKGRSKIANYRHGGRTKKFGGGRTNLLEQLGRVEAEPSNPNRRAEISRVHGELNRGYAKGGRIGKNIGGTMKAGRLLTKTLERLGGGSEGKPHSTRAGRISAGARRIKRGVKKAKREDKAEGGRIGFKKGGSDKKWIQKAVNPKHKGYCTPMTKKTCTPARKALARTFKKKAKTGWG
jgi:hypothetical protein